MELIVLDVDDSLTHPFHLHGHKFYVMDMSTFTDPITANEILKNGVPLKKKKANPNPPHKDSILIPNPGYIRLQFRADNPGFWLGHCHFDWHLAIGKNHLIITKQELEFVVSRHGRCFSSWRARSDEEET